MGWNVGPRFVPYIMMNAFGYTNTHQPISVLALLHCSPGTLGFTLRYIRIRHTTFSGPCPVYTEVHIQGFMPLLCNIQAISHLCPWLITNVHGIHD